MKPIPIPAFNPGPMTGEGNTTWLISGRVPTLIDAGTGEWQHLAALESALGGTRLAQVLVTHSHIDHASGAPVIAERMPHVRFFKMPWLEHDFRWPVRWEPLAADAAVTAGDTILRVVHTPGHSPDHLCFWHDESRALFCGDLAWMGSTVVIPPSDGGDLNAYLASLARVLELAPATMLPAHGPVIDQPATLLGEYIAHRNLREQQILGALRAGAGDPGEIVASVYAGLIPPLVAVARETVLAHLLKLEQDGRVRRREGRWGLTENAKS